MLNKNKLASLGLATVLACGTTAGVQAAMVNFTITGDVLIGEETFDNIFNLYAGDTITLSGSFDDSVLLGGTGTVSFDMGSLSNSFVLTAGSMTYFETDDVSYPGGIGGAGISFVAGELTNVDFLTSDYNFSSFGTGFDDGLVMYGEWRSQVDMTPVPVPAAVWLFGSGLIGLAAALRKKQ